MKKVLFDANTPYQLMVAVIIVNYYYKEDYTTILLSDKLKDFQSRLESLKIFSKAIHIQEKGRRNLEIVKEINTLELFDVDIFHFTSYSNLQSCYFFNNVKKTCKKIISEEGIASYNIFENYKNFLKSYPNHRADVVDLKEAESIWFFNKELVTLGYEDIEIYEIALGELIQKDGDEFAFVELLNRVFEYEYKELSHHIFFTQNFIAYKCVTYEESQIFFQKLYDIFHKSLKITLHPYDYEKKLYSDIGFDFFEKRMIPWEVILLNQIHKNKNINDFYFITVGSTSLAANSMMLKYKKQELNNILLYKIFETPFSENSERFYSKVMQKSTIKYFIPESFQELENYMSKKPL